MTQAYVWIFSVVRVTLAPLSKLRAATTAAIKSSHLAEDCATRQGTVLKHFQHHRTPEGQEIQ